MVLKEKGNGEFKKGGKNLTMLFAIPDSNGITVAAVTCGCVFLRACGGRGIVHGSPAHLSFQLQ